MALAGFDGFLARSSSSRVLRLVSHRDHRVDSTGFRYYSYQKSRAGSVSEGSSGNW